MGKIYLYSAGYDLVKPKKEKRFMFDGVIGPDKEDIGIWTPDLLKQNNNNTNNLFTFLVIGLIHVSFIYFLNETSTNPQ